MRNSHYLALAILYYGVFAFGQQPAPSAPQSKAPASQLKHSTAPTAGEKSAADTGEEEIPVKTIEMRGGKPLTGLLDTGITGPPSCTSEGTAYLEIFGDLPPTTQVFAGDLYSVSESGEVKKIERNLTAPQRTDLSAFWMYPGTDAVATLYRLTPRDRGEDGELLQPKYHIALSRNDGSFLKDIKLDLKFQPLKIAMLDSGRFLALGVEPLNDEPMLSLLDSDGTYLRTIDLDPGPVAASNSLQTINAKLLSHAEPSHAATVMASDAMFVPYGNKVLFFVPGSGLPVRILGEGGEENAVTLSLPKGELLQSVLPAGKNDTWVVRAQRLGNFASMKNKGVLINPSQKLFEVDPVTGKVMRELNIIGALPAHVLCATNRKLTALLYFSGDDAKRLNTFSGWRLEVEDR